MIIRPEAQIMIHLLDLSYEMRAIDPCYDANIDPQVNGRQLSYFDTQIWSHWLIVFCSHSKNITVALGWNNKNIR